MVTWVCPSKQFDRLRNRTDFSYRQVSLESRWIFTSNERMLWKYSSTNAMRISIRMGKFIWNGSWSISSRFSLSLIFRPVRIFIEKYVVGKISNVVDDSSISLTKNVIHKRHFSCYIKRKKENCSLFDDFHCSQIETLF